MSAGGCEEMGRRLVDYSDGELPPDQVQEVVDHLEACPACAKLLKALDLSLTLTTTLWETALTSKTVDGKTHAASASTCYRWPWKTVASVAACVAIVVSAAFIWRNVSPASGRPPALAEIERDVQRSGRAARQLMVAEILASCDDTEDMLARHNLYMAETFSKRPFGVGGP